MYKLKKIGVGIVTCNRRESYVQLLEKVRQNKDIDFICVVKNRDFDYGNDDPSQLSDFEGRIVSHVIPEDVGVGCCKNWCLTQMLDAGCQHMFLIEDDINIKRDDVFRKYIETANAFSVAHLNFCNVFDPNINKKLEPFMTYILTEDMKIDFFRKLGGSFSYFTRAGLQRVGLMNDVDYVNALEHCEHTYRFIISGLYSLYNAFADIHHSDLYLEDKGSATTINYGEELYNQRLKHAVETFKQTYGKWLQEFHAPSVVEVSQFMYRRFIRQKQEK